MEKTDVLILGAGAAGLLCGIEAARRGRRTLVLDHAARPGEKIRISGGGRCNFTNREAPVERFLSENPRFALSALRRFTPDDFLQRLQAAGIGWEERDRGQLFGTGSARLIVDWLTRDLAEAGGRLWLSTGLDALYREGEGFLAQTTRGPVLAAKVVVATGGKSIPKMGATGLGYQIAGSFGLRVTETRPALVPLTFAEQELARMKPLAGVATTARVTAGWATFEAGLLFTHRGLSGPAVLQASSYWREGEPVTIDLAPGAGPLSGPTVRAALSRLMPDRLAASVAAEAGVEGPLAPLPRAARERLDASLHRWTLRPVGTEGYRTAEVTLGGVDTAALDARTLEARSVPGLHFVGEVVDVTGWLGGYNFQWAWSSGWAAGQAV